MEKLTYKIIINIFSCATIEKYKQERQTKSVIEEIEYHTRMVEQLSRQLKEQYQIATELYKIVDGEVLPKFNWENIFQFTDLEKLHPNNWNEWQTITLKNGSEISKMAFALESKPSMYPRFPKDTVFIIASDINPSDGDLVLVKLKQNNEFTLRELLLDPPEKRLLPLVEESKSINFDESEHEILGVCCLTILYDHKIKIAK